MNPIKNFLFISALAMVLWCVSCKDLGCSNPTVQRILEKNSHSRQTRSPSPCFPSPATVPVPKYAGPYYRPNYDFGVIRPSTGVYGSAQNYPSPGDGYDGYYSPRSDDGITNRKGCSYRNGVPIACA